MTVNHGPNNVIRQLHRQYFIKRYIGAREIAQFLRAFVALSEVLGSIFSTHMVVQNHL